MRHGALSPTNNVLFCEQGFALYALPIKLFGVQTFLINARGSSHTLEALKPFRFGGLIQGLRDGRPYLASIAFSPASSELTASAMAISADKTSFDWAHNMPQS